jgi:hypothetical protein
VPNIVIETKKKKKKQKILESSHGLFVKQIRGRFFPKEKYTDRKS